MSFSYLHTIFMNISTNYPTNKNNFRIPCNRDIKKAPPLQYVVERVALNIVGHLGLEPRTSRL